MSTTSPGCDIDLGDETTGDEGRVAFRYISGSGCFFGCDMDRALLRGTRETITVDGPGDDRGVWALSSDPSVATFTVERECTCEYCGEYDDEGHGCSGTYAGGEYETCTGGGVLECYNAIEVEAHAEGDTYLELRGEDGGLVDRVEVHVRRVARGFIEGMTEEDEDYRVAERFRLRRGERLTLSARLLDDRGRELLTSHGVDWEIERPDVAGPESDFDFWPASDLFDLVAEQPGITEVTVRAAGFRESVTVEVTR